MVCMSKKLEKDVKKRKGIVDLEKIVIDLEKITVDLKAKEEVAFIKDGLIFFD